MEGRSVEMRGALKVLEPRQANEVIAGPIIRFAGTFPDIGAATPQELINRRVPFVPVARLRIGQRDDPWGQVLALINVENRILAQHGNQARCGLIVRVFVAYLELLHEVYLGAALPLTNVAAQLQSLFVGKESR